MILLNASFSALPLASAGGSFGGPRRTFIEVSAGSVLQRMKVASGAQCTGILHLTSLTIGPKSSAGRGRILKEENREQSAAAYKTPPQQAAGRAYILEKG